MGAARFPAGAKAVTAMLAAAAVAGLAGCSVFGSDDEASAEAAAQAAEDALARPPEPVEAVEKIEIGRTRTGLVITAIGVAPGLGYARPRLRPRREGQPGTDGLIDFDFVATPPDPGLALGQGDVRARTLRADYLIDIETLRQARGIRIHGRDRGVQLVF